MNHPSEPPMVELRGITKRFHALEAVRDVSLEIRRGEFLTLLGPSGCGKTTVLRIIAGFETPTHGTVLLDGRDVTALPPNRRDVNQVFQNYALFPHLTVRENIAFGLQMKRLPRTEIAERVRGAVGLVSLDGKEESRPAALSGGQRQRVALARAIVCEPKVLLLDEPLSALDAQLRQQMQVELKHLQRRLGITFVLVTHDQGEALAMSDRVALMNAGRIEQLGSPAEIYDHPRSRFVAEFIGQANVLPAHVIEREAGSAVVGLRGDIRLRVQGADAPEPGAEILVSMRPERIRLSTGQDAGGNRFEATVIEGIFRGQSDHYLIRTAGGIELTVATPNESGTRTRFRTGDRVVCLVHPADIILLAPG
jgi:spermidine/putrescine transport system ATP-binding protein